MDIDETAVRRLLTLLNPLHGWLDQQLYEERREQRRQGDEPARDHDYEVRVTDGMERDLAEAVNLLESRLPGSGLLEYPRDITPALHDILSMMVFELSPMAHAFRDAGFAIKERVEAEQAFILHWLIQTALEHGDNWRQVAGKRLGEIIDQAKQKNAEKARMSG